MRREVMAALADANCVPVAVAAHVPVYERMSDARVTWSRPR
jgi:hypothetical protein